MKSLFLLTVGTALGFFLAHQINQTRGGQEFFSGLDGRLKQFSTAVVDGYRARDAELRDQA